MCSVKVITGHVGLLTCVHSWTHVQILTCPVITVTGHKPFPLVYYLKFTFLHFKQHYTYISTHFYLLIFITTISLPCELRQPNRNIFSFQKFPPPSILFPKANFHGFANHFKFLYGSSPSTTTSLISLLDGKY